MTEVLNMGWEFIWENLL